MGPRSEVLFSLLFATLVSSNLILCNVNASRVARFFNKDPAYNNPTERENAGYLDPKEYYPTGTENNYNGYSESGEGRRSSYGNGAGEGGGYREGVNGYGRGAEFTPENAVAGDGYAEQGLGNGGGYGSGEWHGSNGGARYGQGAEYVSGYGNGFNEFGNGNGYGSGSGAGYGNGNGNGNGEYIPNNAYRQENP